MYEIIWLCNVFNFLLKMSMTPCTLAYKYHRLSLSRRPRDSLKYFEISVPRHIRFAELRKKINRTTTFQKWIGNLTPEVRDIRGSSKKFCHWVRITSVLRFIKHIFITNLQSIFPLLKHIFVTFLSSREKQINSPLLVSVGDTDK